VKNCGFNESTCITVPDLTVLLVALVPFGDAPTVAADWRQPTNQDGYSEPRSPRHDSFVVRRLALPADSVRNTSTTLA
jgi:hypothetical protein